MRYPIFLLIGIFLGAVGYSYSQSNDTLVAMECHYGNEIGVKLGVVQLSNIIVSSSSSDLIDEYVIDYKRKFGHNQAMRIGLSGSYVQEINEGYNPSDRTIGLIAPRIGWEYNHYFSQRWSTFYGGDLLGQYRSYKRVDRDYYYSTNHTSANEITTRESYRAGVGPFLGFEFAISQRFSLSTSMQLILFYEQETRKEVIKDNDKLLSQKSETNTERIGGIFFRSNP